MKTRYVFDHDAYHTTLKNIAEGKTFVGNVQLGGGLGGVCKRLVKFLIPLIKSHVVPHIRSLASNVVDDVINKKVGIKESVIKQTAQLAANLQKSVSSLSNQSGAGIQRGLKRNKVKPIQSVRKKKTVRKTAKKKTKFDFLT